MISHFLFLHKIKKFWFHFSLIYLLGYYWLINNLERHFPEWFKKKSSFPFNIFFCVCLLAKLNVFRYINLTGSWYNFVGKWCDSCRWLWWFQFTKYVTLIICGWCRSSCNKGKYTSGIKNWFVLIAKLVLMNELSRLKISKLNFTYLLLTGTSPVARTLHLRSSGSRPQCEMLVAG